MVYSDDERPFRRPQPQPAVPSFDDTLEQGRSFFDETGMVANAPPRSILDVELDPIRAAVQESILTEMENLTVGPPSKDEIVIIGDTTLFNRHISQIEDYVQRSDILFLHRYYR